MAKTRVRVWRGVREDERYPVYSLTEGRDAAFTPAELLHIERVTAQYEAVQAFIIERYDSMEATKARVAAEKAAAEAAERKRWKDACKGVILSGEDSDPVFVLKDRTGEVDRVVVSTTWLGWLVRCPSDLRAQMYYRAMVCMLRDGL